MFTCGLDGEDFILFTDAAEQCAGMCKVKLSRNEAEAMVKQAAHLLAITAPARAAIALPAAEFPTVRLVPAPEPDETAGEAASFANATLEAAAADAAAIEARRRHEAEQKRREEERERRRILKANPGLAEDE